MSALVKELDVLIVGAGIAGMSAYLEAKKNSSLQVAIVEYENEPGGELRFYEGFRSAHELRKQFDDVSAASEEVFYQTTAIGVLPSMRPGQLLEINVSSARGTETVYAKRMLVCTGMVDLSRENNRIPGQRPAGVVTPNFVVRALKEQAVPGLKTIVFVENLRDVEAAKLLKKNGVDIVAVLATKEALRLYGYAMENLGLKHECEEVTEISGRARVEGVSFRNSAGEVNHIVCDSFIYASGYRSAAYALKGSGVAMQGHTDGIVVDEHGETSIPDVFAAGTCVTLNPHHAASAEDGRRVMAHIIRDLSAERSLA